MPTNEEAIDLVRRFLATWDTGDVDDIVDFWTDDGVYHNMPIDPVTGKEGIRAMVRAFYTGEFEGVKREGWGVDTIHMEVLNIIASGNLVMAERLDTVTVPKGSIQLPCTGVFELRDGKIAAFRDYFDHGQHTRLLAELG